jgi:hypothetical protein
MLTEAALPSVAFSAPKPIDLPNHVLVQEVKSKYLYDYFISESNAYLLLFRTKCKIKRRLPIIWDLL